MDGISRKRCTWLIFLATQTQHAPKTSTQLFNQSLSLPFCTCILLMNFPILCQILRNKKLTREKCQELHICLIRLDKQTQNFPNNHLNFSNHVANQQISICKISFNYNVPEKCQCIANSVDGIAISWGKARSDFSWKAKLFFSKTSRCHSFLKVSVIFFITCKNLREYQLLRSVSGEANLIGGVCQ